MTTQVAVPQEVSQSVVELPAQEMDQDVQVLVERKLQELVDLLEKHGCTYWKNWEPPEYWVRRIGPHVAPSQCGVIFSELGQIQQFLSNFDEDQSSLPMLHSILEWYMHVHYSRVVLSPNSGQPLVSAQT